MAEYEKDLEQIESEADKIEKQGETLDQDAAQLETLQHQLDAAQTMDADTRRTVETMVSKERAAIEARRKERVEQRSQELNKELTDIRKELDDQNKADKQVLGGLDDLRLSEDGSEIYQAKQHMQENLTKQMEQLSSAERLSLRIQAANQFLRYRK